MHTCDFCFKSSEMNIEIKLKNVSFIISNLNIINAIDSYISTAYKLGMPSQALHTCMLCASKVTKVLLIEWIHRIQAINTVNRQHIYKSSGEQTA